MENCSYFMEEVSGVQKGKNALIFFVSNHVPGESLCHFAEFLVKIISY